jgi:hypothetical protein
MARLCPVDIRAGARRLAARVHEGAALAGSGHPQPGSELAQSLPDGGEEAGRALALEDSAAGHEGGGGGEGQSEEENGEGAIRTLRIEGPFWSGPPFRSAGVGGG